MKKINKWRDFEGQRFQYYTHTTTKATANKVAEGLRKDTGLNVRIVPRKSDGIYILYVKKKKGLKIKKRVDPSTKTNKPVIENQRITIRRTYLQERGKPRVLVNEQENIKTNYEIPSKKKVEKLKETKNGE